MPGTPHGEVVQESCTTFLGGPGEDFPCTVSGPARRDRRAARGRFRQARGRRCTGSESSATAEKVPSKTGHFALFRRLQRPGAPRQPRRAPEVRSGLVLGRFPPFWRALSSSRPHTHSTMDIYRLSARSGFWCPTAAFLVASQCPLDPRAGTTGHQGGLLKTAPTKVH